MKPPFKIAPLDRYIGGPAYIAWGNWGIKSPIVPFNGRYTIYHLVRRFVGAFQGPIHGRRFRWAWLRKIDLYVSWYSNRAVLAVMGFELDLHERCTFGAQLRS